MVINELISSEINDKVDVRVSFKKQPNNMNGNFYFSLDCDKWLPLSNRIIFDGVLYYCEKSDNVAYDYVIKDAHLHPQKVELQRFFFYEGTPKDVTQVFASGGSIAEEKLPIVWLSFAPIPIITRTYDAREPYPHKIDFTMFFCASTDYVNKRTKEHMEDVVQYIDSYVEVFEKALINNYRFGQNPTTVKKQYPIFGSLDKNGFVKNILDGTMLSAVELKIHVKTELKCEC